MGVPHKILGEFELDNGETCEIEQLVEGHYHIHIGKFQLNVSPEEFEELMEVIVEGYNNIQEVKDI